MVASFKWSIENWHELVESGMLEGKPVQLVEGEIIEMSPEGIEHGYTNSSVADYLRGLLTQVAYVREAHSITLKNNSEPQPDIAIVRLPRDIYKQHHPYPEDIYWLIEISKKTLKFDLEQKSRVYARNGIPEYWVIDLINKKLVVHTELSGERYSKIIEYKDGIIELQAFPGIAVEVSQLLLF